MTFHLIPVFRGVYYYCTTVTFTDLVRSRVVLSRGNTLHGFAWRRQYVANIIQLSKKYFHRANLCLFCISKNGRYLQNVFGIRRGDETDSLTDLKSLRAVINKRVAPLKVVQYLIRQAHTNSHRFRIIIQLKASAFNTPDRPLNIAISLSLFNARVA